MGEQMTDREKLIELLDDAIIAAIDKCHTYEECRSCPSDERNSLCRSPFIADHLISNGVVVREKGEWEVVSEEDYLALYTIKCSKCREEWHFDEESDVVAMCYHFCPNCGADMRKGDNR